MGILDVDHRRATRLIYAAVILHNFLGPFEQAIDMANLGNQQRVNTRGRAPVGTQRAATFRDRFVRYFDG